MLTIRATMPCLAPPAWAVLERKLLDVMDQAVYPYLEKYTRADGSLIWGDRWRNGRDGLDDLYESFYNWPLLYLLGGGDHLLALGQRQWDAITRQGEGFGLVHDEYEVGYDQFHQAESYIYFYFLCLADPANPTNRARAQRFAGFYLNEDPDAPNYDAERKLIRAPHNGSRGPRWGFNEGTPNYGWSAGMRVYGLPFSDVPGIDHYDDLKDPEKARRMGDVMRARMGQGDVATNLLVTSLVANAYLMTGAAKYRQWIVEYVDAWRARADANGGLLPDNVGLSGQVGETMGGKWYGGLYGWTWPHGYYNIGMAATVAAANVFLLTQDPSYLDLPRQQYDAVVALGEVRDTRDLEMSLRHHWVGALEEEGQSAITFVAPYRYGDAGWFDYQPLSPIYPAALWNLSMARADWERLEHLRRHEPFDWRSVAPFRTKEDSGHERPWLRYLAGDNPDYPERILQASYATACRRLALIAADKADLAQVNIHHWQELNPVVTEALVQLTLGAPQTIYNGGLLFCRLRYFDAERRRPGLPPDVAALVERLEADETVVTLVNLSPFAARRVILQAGGFGEHRFGRASFEVRTSDYPGSQKMYAPPPLTSTTETVSVDSPHLEVELPPASTIRLTLQTARFVNAPSYALPWAGDDSPDA
ncbi:MAG: hypothetical protein IT329_22170 [Caldilineaceae bacterium]|nr:hypothetical protein [Caldilineaceae bacterium]